MAWAWLAFVAVCLFWGTSGPLIRYAVRYVEPLQLVTLRFVSAGVFLWLMLALLGRRPPLSGLARVAPSGLALGISNLLVTYGFQRVEAGSGALLLATTAVIFAVVDVLWPGGSSKPTTSVWFGLLLGLLGVSILFVSPRSLGQGDWRGYLMLEASAWIWATSGVAQARRPSGLDPLQSSTWQMLIAGAMTAPFAWLVGGQQLRSIAVQGWLATLALVITASLIGFVSFVAILRKLPPYVVGSYTYVNAVVAAAVGVLWLGEHLSARFYLAALLVLGGVALSQYRTLRQRGATK